MRYQCLLANKEHPRATPTSSYFPDLTATAEVIAEPRKIIAAGGVTICGRNGQGPPLMNETAGMTGNRSYAEVVTAILIAAAMRVLPLPDARKHHRGHDERFPGIPAADRDEHEDLIP
ncbi:hypothetical protein [Arthrobacter sp. NPDC058192]|uniref:hypothetical protein n=1 Tax=Arthrobacter sp. NPDC058192 TaxID=3346372 RepID=UPI0036E422B4